MYAKIRELLAADAPQTGNVSLDVELFIRLLEWAREEVKEDVPLHVAAERLASVCQGGKVATMADYADIVPVDEQQTSPVPELAGYGDPEWSLKIEGRGDFDWRGFLSSLGALGNWGCSRSVEIAPGDADTKKQLEDAGYRTVFGYDGDGADCIISAERNSEKVWPPKG